MPEEEVDMFQVLDPEHKGSVSVQAFEAWWDTQTQYQDMSEERLDKLTQAIAYFQYFDKDHSGHLDAEEFRFVASEFTGLLHVSQAFTFFLPFAS